MFHADGTLLARIREVDELIGQNFAKGAVAAACPGAGRTADAAREKPDRPTGPARIGRPARRITRASS